MTIKDILIFCLCLGSILLPILLIILAIHYDKKAIQKKYDSTTLGVIIDMRPSEYNNSFSVHTSYPTVKYSIQGNNYIKKPSRVVRTKNYSLGKTVKIYYNSKNPVECHIEGIDPFDGCLSALLFLGELFR